MFNYIDLIIKIICQNKWSIFDVKWLKNVPGKPDVTRKNPMKPKVQVASRERCPIRCPVFDRRLYSWPSWPMRWFFSTFLVWSQLTSFVLNNAFWGPLIRGLQNLKGINKMTPMESLHISLKNHSTFSRCLALVPKIVILGDKPRSIHP